MIGIIDKWIEEVKKKTREISPDADYWDVYDEQFDKLRTQISKEFDRLLSQEVYGKEPITDLSFIYSRKDLKDLKQTLLNRLGG